MSRVYDRGKRAFDVVIGMVAVVVTAPVMVATGLAVFLVLGRPILFRQQRPGVDGRPFMMVKFRSMHEAHEVGSSEPADEKRLGRFGCWLRATSLDELPELYNVVKGDMSLVGPRPLLMEYLPLYTIEQRRRHEVRPGITGWAQVNGRNAISWREKLEHDVWYVDHRSIWLDLHILWRTAIKVLAREGISQQGQATAERFTGTEK